MPTRPSRHLTRVEPEEREHIPAWEIALMVSLVPVTVVTYLWVLPWLVGVWAG